MKKIIKTCDYCGNDITADEESTIYRRAIRQEILIKDVCESCTKEMIGMMSFLGIDLYDCFIPDKRGENKNG